MKYKQTKYGFSLPEALMTLLIVSICAVVSTPVILKKYEKKQLIVHGIWECDMTTTPYTQTKRTKEGVVEETSKVSSCTFIPPTGAVDFNVDICGQYRPGTSCNFDDASHVFMYYPSMRRVNGIGISGKTVNFGDLIYAIYRGPGAKITVLY